MQPELLEKLYEARGLAGTPFTITSAYRCPLHELRQKNPTSAHNRGYAVDIAATTSRYRFKIMKALLAVGFTRVGWNQQLNFFHVDCDPTLPPEVLFKY